MHDRRRHLLEELLDTENLRAACARASRMTRAADRTDPVAREWLRRWGPAGLTPRLPTCRCTTGHCQICN